MRVLVEQTRDNCLLWLKRLCLSGGEIEIERSNGKDKVKEYIPDWINTDKINVTVLMGGEDKDDWDLYPDRDAIIIGTQDMLLSRALNRGYGMSRYRWPVHFGWLNNDCLWVMDEIQLMGVGVETTSQLSAFRQKINTFGNCKSIWMSATMDLKRLNTVDRDEELNIIDFEKTNEINESLRNRITAEKHIEKAKFEEGKIYLDKESEKTSYYSDISNLIKKEHQEGLLSLIIVNTVKRAQELYKKVKEKMGENTRVSLIHSRFREQDRKQKIELLLAEGDRVIISTQVIEAGVDISARLLITELAPWYSLVQRFGRCNRKGEFKNARIIWIDIDENSSGAPYSDTELNSARSELESLSNASPHDLSKKDIKPEEIVRPVIRKKDIIELFDTTPDLTGNDLDISRYIRESDGKEVQVYWREIPAEGPSKDMKSSHRSELCNVPIGDIKEFVKKKGDQSGCWIWDHLDEDWKKVGQISNLHPGMILLLDYESGGYSNELGWIGKAWRQKDGNVAQIPLKASDENDSISSEKDTFIGADITIQDHCRDVSGMCAKLCQRLGITDDLMKAISTAGMWHDIGKAHEAFQNALKDDMNPDILLAKTRDNKNRLQYFTIENGVRKNRRYFRHELASALAWLQSNKNETENNNLIAYLIGAHHGKVRLSIRSLPEETEPENTEIKFARGVWDGDIIPSVKGIMDKELRLDLTPMELGEGSWLEKTLDLLESHGPFSLAYLESILRISDWIVSGNYNKEDVQ